MTQLRRTHESIERLARQTVTRGLSVRQVESLVRRERTRAECAAFHLRQAERRVVGSDDDVRVADQADAAAHAEAVDGRNDRNRAFIDRAERGEAAAVGVDERGEAFGALHLRDVDAGVEAPALGAKDHDVGLGILAGLGDDVGELEPAARRDGVHRRIVDGDRDYARLGGGGRDRHRIPRSLPGVAT